MSTKHHYNITTEWTGNRGSGTLDYRAYSRDHIINANGKNQAIEGSSDPNFRGNKARYNPEELFISSISTCHMLWYLHLAAVNNIIVLEYADHAEGTMEEPADEAGRFTAVTLKPVIKIAQGGNLELAESLHAEAGKKCYIANSVKVKVDYKPEISVI